MSLTAAVLSRRRCTKEVENLAFVVDRAPQPEPPTCKCHGQVSGAGEFRPRALSEPDVTLASSGSHCSAALIRLCSIHEDPPVAGCPHSRAEQRNPFAPAPLQDLQHYYGLLRPCAPPRYSHPHRDRLFGFLP